MVRFKYSACGIGSVSMLNLWREIEWMNLWHKGYASAAYLHFLVSWTKFVEKSEESFGTEIPLTRGEELQYIQTITDTSLDATHAEIYILYISQKWSIEIGWFTRSYSQSWLAKTEHQEINDVGRHPLVEEQFQCMHEFVSGHVAAWIPDTGLKWIFVVQIPAKVKYFPPCNLLAVRAGHIEHRNVFRSANYVFFYFRLTSCILRYFVLISSTHFTTVVPIFHATEINPLIAMSTGMTSERNSPLHNMVRITPLAPPTMIPIGPLRLSTHPGTGSSHAGETAK